MESSTIYNYTMRAEEVSAANAWWVKAGGSSNTADYPIVKLTLWASVALLHFLFFIV
jgi:hypothetical protein